MSLKLPNLTVFASMHSTDEKYLERTVRVLDHCDRLLSPGKLILFYRGSTIPVMPCKLIWKTIPCRDFQQWMTWINHVAPSELTGDFIMHVHEDGFPIDPDQWTDDFFNYDYIGAPWPNKEVGNGGFTLESRKFSLSKMWLPSQWPPELPDVAVCRTHRKTLEAQGLKFAPFEIGARFACEFPEFKDIPHFGYHGKSPHGDYARAWKILEEGERAAWASTPT